jgi:hypothetical protein
VLVIANSARLAAGARLIKIRAFWLLFPKPDFAGVDVHVCVIQKQALAGLIGGAAQFGEPTDVFNGGAAVKSVNVEPTFGVNGGNRGAVANERERTIGVIFHFGGGLGMSFKPVSHYSNLLSFVRGGVPRDYKIPLSSENVNTFFKKFYKLFF